MFCFNHENVNAVGICLSCGKAICKSCSIEAGGLLACSEECLHNLEVKNKAGYKLKREVSLEWGFGLAFVGYGFYHLIFGIFEMALYCIIFGLLFIVYAWKWPKIGKSKN